MAVGNHKVETIEVGGSHNLKGAACIAHMKVDIQAAVDRYNGELLKIAFVPPCKGTKAFLILVIEE